MCPCERARARVCVYVCEVSGGEEEEEEGVAVMQA